MSTDPRVLDAAARALVAAASDDAEGVVAALNELTNGADLGLAILGWIDTVADRMGLPNGKPVGLAFAPHGTTDYGWADSAPRSTVVWAGQLFTARVNRDERTYLALMRAIPPGQEAAHVLELLNSCGLMVRNPPPLITSDQVRGGGS